MMTLVAQTSLSFHHATEKLLCYTMPPSMGATPTFSLQSEIVRHNITVCKTERIFVHPSIFVKMVKRILIKISKYNKYHTTQVGG